MSLVKTIAVLTLTAFPLVCLAQTDFYHVPFYNADVQPGKKINAGYNFDPAHQVLVCTSTSLASAAVYWVHKGSLYSAILPAGGRLSLKDHSYPEGFFADSKGTISINHSITEKMILKVSCEYHTWG